ncbi:MAG TPA: biotin/lipoate A/B protein ligase family protein [Verrucomicrobiae bacterium]|nr:biotin/lipoate A/B protein ligase family protein [Verrucomicrobiae bacterium]
MNRFDCTFASPAENLAADEALLDWREKNGGEEILRFWESPEIFVVCGYANKIATEVNAENCAAKKIPILRRCSGGGTVLQGRGCLNYALILRIAINSPLAGISNANQFIMEQNRKAIENESRISISGHTDLTIGDLKFSGNSQRRRKHFLLFHGTFLLNFDLKLIGEFLQMPSLQPNYRNARKHEQFLTNLNLSAESVKSALAQIWNANNELQNPPLEEIKKLAQEKYSTPEWNFKF